MEAGGMDEQKNCIIGEETWNARASSVQILISSCSWNSITLRDGSAERTNTS